MEEPLLEAEGVNTHIELLQDKVLIKRKGLMAKPGGDRNIPISSIASVEFKAPSTLVNGYIQFVLGGQVPKTGFMARSQDPYSVDFIYDNKPQFEELKQAIEQRIAERQGPAEPPPASISPGTREFNVEGKPDIVLKMVRGFFDSDEWPYRTWHLFSFSTSRSEVWARNSGPDSFFFGRGNKVSSLLSKPSLADTPGGIIIILLLSIITFGAFMPLYFMVTIVTAIQAVGIIMVVALLVTPSATAYLFARRFHHMILASVATGGLSALLGIYLSYYLDLASGAAIILVATAVFFVTLTLTGSARKLSGISRE